MKKILCFSLALFFLVSLAVGVSAENGPSQTETEEIIAQSIEVTDLVLPTAGEKVAKKPADALSVKVMGGAKSASPKEIPFEALDAYWVEADNEKEALTSDDKFVSGRTYRIFITLEFAEEAPLVKADETRFTVNSAKAKHEKNEGKKIVFSCDFVATPGDYTPKVSLTVEGEKKKEYDGKETVLSAVVEKTEGVTYTFSWYRDDKLLEGKTEEKLKLKNVSDSGEYYVQVSAALSAAGVKKTTKSATQKITIQPHVVNIEIHDAEKNVFEPDPKFTYEVVGEIYDELTGELERLEGEDIGKYSILIGTVSFPEEIAENYEIRVDQGTLTVIDVGQLPFVQVMDVADRSYISGRNGAKIRISAPKGSIPEDAILSLSLLSADDKDELERGLGKMIKGFQIDLLDENGKKIKLLSRASLRIQIPLAKEDEKFDPETITAGLLASSVTGLETKVTETSSVTYITVEIEDLGAVALFEGDVIKSEKKPVDKKEPEKEKGASLWVWILIVVVSLAAIGAIAAVIIIQKKKDTEEKGEKKPEKKAVPEKKNTEEKEKAKRIAEHLNSLPPVPPKKVEDEGMQTRAFSGDIENLVKEAAEDSDEDMKIVPESLDEDMKIVPEKEAPKEEKPHVISFEDLED